MSYFRNTFNSIKENKERVEEGKVNCIPFIKFNRLRTKIPGIIKGTNWLVTANSGVGKSQLTKSMFILEPFQWIKQYPEKGVSLKVLYFALEDSKEEFTYSMISHKLKEKFGLTVDPLELASMYEDKTITDELLDKIETLEEYFNDFYNHVEVIDSISNPTGIYKYIRRYSKDNGTHYYYNFKTDKEKQNVITEQEYSKLIDNTLNKHTNTPTYGKDYFAYSHYIPNNPDEYVICIVDHFSLLHPESNKTLHETMTLMSAHYGRKQITKHFNYVFVNVQQQMAASEENVFTNAGKKIIEKLKPSLQGLADNKLTARDCHVVLGLFAPIRYYIEEYNGFDITRLDDQFRSLTVLKNRIGRGNIEVPLYFNGAVTRFTELPLEMSNQDYINIENVQKEMR